MYNLTAVTINSTSFGNEVIVDTVTEASLTDSRYSLCEDTTESLLPSQGVSTCVKDIIYKIIKG